nr:MAG TPA: ChiA1-BD-binding domain protein [Caudoviricetes sp.]
MYEIFKSVIASKSYNLEEMIKKINIRWVEDILTEEQRKELVALAQTNADPSQSNAPLQKQIEEISKKQIALEDTVEKLSAMVQKIKETVEGGGTVVPDPEPPITEEYPVWEPYNGIPPVPYQVGSKVTHDGKKWESMVPNNVWEPGVFGVDQNIWKEVV